MGKLNERDKVIVVKGLYKGCEGIVTSVHTYHYGLKENAHNYYCVYFDDKNVKRRKFQSQFLKKIDEENNNEENEIKEMYFAMRASSR